MGDSESAVKGQCCQETCHSVMNANNWTCDAGQMRGEHDFHNPYSMGDSESAVKGQCCHETCHRVMNANNWTCDAGRMRGEYDLHNPFSNGTGEDQVKQECCRESCPTVMNANNWTCDAGQMRGETDFHNPYTMGDSESAVKGACCVQTCHSVMKDRTLTCGSGMSTRDIDDYHEPSGGWHQSDDIILYECCQAPPACLVSCAGLCGVIPNGDPTISWCECFNSNCWAPSGALESCPETTFDADDDEDKATKDDIINYIYDDPEGFKCVKPDFPPGTGVSMPKKCGGGLYVHRKNRPGETCKECAAGKFSKTDKKRNRRCKKCGKNRYQNKKGSTSCIKCPPGFNTKGQRGKKQCFDSSTGKSMKQLGMYGWNQK